MWVPLILTVESYWDEVYHWPEKFCGIMQAGCSSSTCSGVNAAKTNHPMSPYSHLIAFTKCRKYATTNIFIWVECCAMEWGGEGLLGNDIRVYEEDKHTRGGLHSLRALIRISRELVAAGRGRQDVLFPVLGPLLIVQSKNTLDLKLERQSYHNHNKEHTHHFTLVLFVHV